VVGWRGRAILIPGRSRTGKTRLVEELVRRGARYLSDEYAVLDDEGLVHSYARIPSPRDEHGVPRSVPVDGLAATGGEALPVGLIVVTAYRPGAPWRPVPLRGGRAVMPLIDNTVLARREPERMMRLAAKLSQSVLTLEGMRGDVAFMAPSLLRSLDELLDGSNAVVPDASTAEPPTVGTAEVSYVIPSTFAHDHLQRCLTSIRTWSPGSEIIVVANGCVRSPEAVALADRVVELEANLGFGGGVNRGALEASRRLICVMNDDACFVDDTPHRLVRAAAAGKIVGPFSNEAKFPQGAVDPRRVPDASIPSDMVVGMCMMMPADVFCTLRGFDPRLTTWEDDDICLRAVAVGVGSEIVGGAYVHHDGGATFRAQGADLAAIMQSNARTFRRLHPRIGVIAIGKDEAGAIEGFYRQFEPVTRQWFLLDTGSTDGSLESAGRLGVRIESGAFQDFSQARNCALDLFGGDLDWVVMLDPDERLDPHTIRHLEALAAGGEDDVYLAPLRALLADGSTRPFVPKPFLFRSTDAIRWTFAVHEKLIGSRRQALVSNAVIEHHLALHDDGRRARAAQLYAGLQAREPYFTDAAYRARMRADWPLLDYDRLDDDRLRKISIGPLVSVIVPTYRRPALLREAVRSALAQDYRNLEVIVVGDACPDLDGVVFDDARVRIVNLPTNHGAGGAIPRNYGIMLAAGEIVAYLDDDNAWLPNHVSSVYEAMRAADARFGFSSMQVDGVDLRFAEPVHQGIDTSCALHDRELIRRAGWWRSRDDVGYAHDWEFLRRVVDAAEAWVCTRLPTLVYRAESSGQEAYFRGLSAR
jgi:GT2 family glycosyltransferase